MEGNHRYGETSGWYESPTQSGPGAGSEYIPYYQQEQIRYTPYTTTPPPTSSIRATQDKIYPQQRMEQAAPTRAKAARMPKEEAIAIASTVKKTVVVLAIALFGLFSSLIVGTFSNAAANTTTPANNQDNSSNVSGQQGNPSDNGGFFQQGGGGYGFGNGNGGGFSQSPHTHTGAS